MTVHIEPVTTLPDTPAGILEYLVRRTSDTIGAQAGRAGAAVIGEVEETGTESIPIEPRDAAALEPWLSGEVSAVPKILVSRTRIAVQEWLFGTGPDRIDVVYALASRRRDAGLVPIFNAQERGLLFLKRMPALPYASYLPAGSWQLAPGETGIVSAADARVAAIRWYVALPADGEPRRRALMDALASPTRPIVEQAIRELAERHAAGAAERFESMLPAADDALRTQLMLGLWILGETKSAEAILENEFRRGKEAWLERWGIRASTNDALLFAPAAPERSDR